MNGPRLPIALALGIALASQAHASGRGDFKRGYQALLRHEYERAIAAFTTAIESGDLTRANLALAYHYRGAENLKVNRYEDAISDLTRALELEPTKLPTAYNDRAIAYRLTGDYAKAIADYSEAIRLWPDLHHWYLNRGRAYAADAQYANAIADYTRALYYRPGLVSALLARADAHASAGETKEALADYDRAQKTHGSLLKDYPGVAERIAALRER